MPIYTLPEPLYPPANYGLLTSNNVSDPNNDIDIAIGQALSDDYSTVIRLISGLTKRLDAAWAAGNNQGMLDTGAKAASTLYALFLIYNPSTLAVDVLASTSFTAPTMPSGYTKKYLLCAILTNAGNNITPYQQAGSSYVNLKEDLTFLSDSTITSNTYETTNIPAPPNSIAYINSFADSTGSTNGAVVLYVRPSIEPSTTGNDFAYMEINVSVAATDVAKRGTVFVSNTSQIKYTAQELTGSITVSISLFGFQILR